MQNPLCIGGRCETVPIRCRGLWCWSPSEEVRPGWEPWRLISTRIDWELSQTHCSECKNGMKEQKPEVGWLSQKKPWLWVGTGCSPVTSTCYSCHSCLSELELLYLQSSWVQSAVRTQKGTGRALGTAGAGISSLTTESCGPLRPLNGQNNKETCGEYKILTRKREGGRCKDWYKEEGRQSWDEEQKWCCHKHFCKWRQVLSAYSITWKIVFRNWCEQKCTLIELCVCLGPSALPAWAPFPPRGFLSPVPWSNANHCLQPAISSSKKLKETKLKD